LNRGKPRGIKPDSRIKDFFDHTWQAAVFSIALAAVIIFLQRLTGLSGYVWLGNAVNFICTFFGAFFGIVAGKRYGALRWTENEWICSIFTEPWNLRFLGYRTSRAKCSAFCCFQAEAVQKLRLLNKSNKSRPVRDVLFTPAAVHGSFAMGQNNFEII
jgi:hypothetical protein